MSFYSLCGAAICTAFMIVIIKEVKGNQAALLTLSIGVLFFGMILMRFDSVVGYLNQLMEPLPNKTYVTALMKSLGIAYLTQFTQEICKLSGEGNIASYVEGIGKAEVLFVCFPMLQELTATALKLI